MILIGFVVAAVITGALVFGIIALYLKMMGKKRKDGLFPLNIKFILISFAIVLLLHILCIQGTEWVLNGFDNSFTSVGAWFEGLRKGLEEIYNQLGGLTFEGQNFNEDANAWVTIFASLYFISILYLAILDAVLIVIGVSYQMYSRIMLLKARLKKSFKHVYIFTYATRESLILAENISKDKDNLIIFASDEIGPYDKDNDIHYRISQSNYLYLPLRRNYEGEHTSILEKLFGRAVRGNNYLSFVEKHQVSIFALETNESEKEKGYESKNSDMVFDDIKDSIDDIKNTTFESLKEKCKTAHIRVNYFILSHHDINFEYYEKSLISIFEKLYQKQGLALKDIPSIFNISVLNEAIMSAEDLVDKRHDNLEKDRACYTNGKGQWSFINQLDHEHRCLVVGFGLNGQMALGHLFSDTLGGVMEGDQFIPNRFNADVLDRNIDNVIASFKAAHPSFVFKAGEYNDKLNVDDECYNYLRKRYSRFENFKELERLMAFPRIFFRKENYNGYEFVTTIEKIVKREYDSVIIAIGSDEKNIECANSILLALRQSNINKDDGAKKVQIFVNIRDFNNNERLAWNEQFDSNVIKNVFVYHFGNARDIYSSSLLKFENGAKIHKTYEEINGVVDNKLTSADWETAFLSGCSLFERKTNFAAYNYRGVYSQFLETSNSMHLIEESYKKYEAAKDKYVEINYKNNNGEDKKANCFDLAVPKKLLDNIKSIEISKYRDDKLKVSLANFERIKMGQGKDKYLSKLSAGYYWRYLIQFDHMRWCRHLMMYGRTYTDNFTPSVYPNVNDSSKNEKYWKNTLLLHDCLLPYSSFTDFKKAPKANYLQYHEEDYDYGVIVGALELEKENAE